MRGDDDKDDDMTTTVETTPEATDAASAPDADPSGTSKAGDNGGHRHRTVRHVAVHGGSAGVVSAAAEVLHVFGPTGLGFGAAAIAATGAGVVAVRRRGRSSRSKGVGGSLARIVRRSVKTSQGSRTAAGLRRTPSGANASRRGRGSVPHSSTLRRRSGSAGRAAGGRAAGVAHRPRGASGSPRSASSKRGVLHRRTRKPSVLGGRAGARGSARRGATSRPGGGTGASRRNQRLGNRVMRRLTRASRTKAAAATRPAGKHAAPVTRAGKIRKQASVHGRAAARITRRQAARSWRFAKAGAKASRPYFRLRPPKGEQKKPAMRVAAKPASTKKPITGTASKPAAKTAKTVAVTKKTAKKAPARPGPAMTAPGLTVKEIMDTTAPSAGITAAAEAITEHIAGFEPENVIDIMGFLSGLDHLFSTLGSSLITVSEKLGSEHPVDASVVDMLQQMGSHALNLGEYGTTAHGLFRAAHETELQRLEQPRVNEQEWDVERNR